MKHKNPFTEQEMQKTGFICVAGSKIEISRLADDLFSQPDEASQLTLFYS